MKIFSDRLRQQEVVCFKLLVINCNLSNARILILVNLERLPMFIYSLEAQIEIKSIFASISLAKYKIKSSAHLKASLKKLINIQ
jgi:hypothetical protein